MLHYMKNWIIFVTACQKYAMSATRWKVNCLQAMNKGCFDCLIFGHQSVNPSREVISILSGKYKRFTFVHPVDLHNILKLKND